MFPKNLFFAGMCTDITVKGFDTLAKMCRPEGWGCHIFPPTINASCSAHDVLNMLATCSFQNRWNATISKEKVESTQYQWIPWYVLHRASPLSKRVCHYDGTVSHVICRPYNMNQLRAFDDRGSYLLNAWPGMLLTCAGRQYPFPRKMKQHKKWSYANNSFSRQQYLNKCANPISTCCYSLCLEWVCICTTHNNRHVGAWSDSYIVMFWEQRNLKFQFGNYDDKTACGECTP